MTQRNRKLVGAFGLVGSIVVYAALASFIYENLLTGMPNWVLLPYFIIAGLGWVFPAGWLIKWMSRPDESETGS